MEKLITRTYRGDLPQLRVMFHCLNKYWTGNRFISIACTKNWSEPDPAIIDDVKAITDTTLTDGWTIEFAPQLETAMGGYEEAQLYNFLLSMDDRFEDSLSIDSKDFLLKPCNINDFKVGNKYRIARFEDPQHRIFSDFYSVFCERFNITHLDVPLPIILTPYLFNRDQTKRIWDQLLVRYGNDFTKWHMFPTGVEWCVYYVGITQDPDPIVEFVPYQGPDKYWMPISGFYKNSDIQVALEHESKFDKYSHTKFWKHHRNATTKESVEVTARMLKNHGINQTVIDHWISEVL